MTTKAVPRLLPIVSLILGDQLEDQSLIRFDLHAFLIDCTCWIGPVMSAGVCVSPGARRSWLIPMTASSPTPQQQNRWKGRRVLAAALIPQPDAYPPEHTHTHTHLLSSYTHLCLS